MTGSVRGHSTKPKKACKRNCDDSSFKKASPPPLISLARKGVPTPSSRPPSPSVQNKRRNRRRPATLLIITLHPPASQTGQLSTRTKVRLILQSFTDANVSFCAPPGAQKALHFRACARVYHAPSCLEETSPGPAMPGHAPNLRNQSPWCRASKILPLLGAVIFSPGAVTAQEITCHGVSDAVWCQALLAQHPVGFCNTPYVPTKP